MLTFNSKGVHIHTGRTVWESFKSTLQCVCYCCNFHSNVLESTVLILNDRTLYTAYVYYIRDWGEGGFQMLNTTNDY